ncbi:MAG: replication-associated recombination protein A [Deltaproteobacteria bacterium]|nr:replication-associated recombination protein A [Deltaproteobacteria bacterium]
MVTRRRGFGESAAGLFDHRARRDAPLAERVRPRVLSDVVGHEALLGPEGPLGRAIAADRLPSMILWGPPGAGKTTLAQVIAASTRATFVPFSAVLHGVAEVRAIVEQARERRLVGGGPTLLFVDEIHRFNKAQQDAFLPHVEDGTVTLIGATTDNPSFALVAPLLSRATVFRLEPIGPDALERMLRRAVDHPDGLARSIAVADEVLAAIAEIARGDGRRSLNLLEVAAEHAARAGKSAVELTDVTDLAGHRTLLYDKAGEEHYNVSSAFIKSMRGSDPDAAVYWMMRMVEAGDDPLFVLRRMIIFASEDVGLADPRALELTVAADAAFRRLGLPEGLYPMAEAALYLACAPKSNAANLAWHRAKERIAATGALPVPLHLRNAPTKLLKEHGYGAGYRYAHDEPDGVARGATYLPDELVGERFYEPTSRGLEGRIGEWLKKLRDDEG